MSGSNLFAAAAEEKLRSSAPLAERMRPQTLDEIVGQQHLLAAGKPLRVLIETDRLGTVILHGPPGVGKTTLARVIARHTGRVFVQESAVTAGVKDVRAIFEGARQRLGEQGRGTILFLDEVHRFNKLQQDALLPGVEDGTIALIGATTENPYFEVNKPLLSRSTVYRLEAISVDDLRVLAERALKTEGVAAEDAALKLLCDKTDGDARALLTTLEVAMTLARERGSQVEVEDVVAARQVRIQSYGVDEHYDIISAFIKSIRGSDADAAIYWLARMLEAGEDARFVARRLVILASEDIGMADPMALVVADAAARAVEFVGLPEAQLNLAQATIHLALAPKSNAVAKAIWSAVTDVREKPPLEVPAALRVGGQGYKYPHDFEDGWVAQDYRPAEASDTPYYTPTKRELRS